jgi:hypothetical protein
MLPDKLVPAVRVTLAEVIDVSTVPETTQGLVPCTAVILPARLVPVVKVTFADEIEVVTVPVT